MVKSESWKIAIMSDIFMALTHVPVALVNCISNYSPRLVSRQQLTSSKTGGLPSNSINHVHDDALEMSMVDGRLFINHHGNSVV